MILSIKDIVDHLITYTVFKVNDVNFSSFRCKGKPHVIIARGARGMNIGKDFAMNNGMRGNPIGHNERCTFFVAPNSTIFIGDNVGISQCALIAYADIKIYNNVKIGGGTVLYTTDFHSLDPKIRISNQDSIFKRTAPITIEEDAFIGARCTILKGVTIGARSIVGACSVVTKNIPPDEIWAGNPAKFIKKID